MVGLIIFVVCFLLFIIITLLIPIVPLEGAIEDLIISFSSFLGVPSDLLTKAILNGFIYSLIIWAIYKWSSNRIQRRSARASRETGNIPLKKSPKQLEPSKVIPQTHTNPPSIIPPPQHTSPPPTGHPYPFQNQVTTQSSYNKILESRKSQTSVKHQKQLATQETYKEEIEKNEFIVSSEILIDKVNELLHQGNITRIIVKDEKGRILLDMPASIGVAGTIAAPWLAGLGAVAALVTKCNISVIRKEN